MWHHLQWVPVQLPQQPLHWGEHLTWQMLVEEEKRVKVWTFGNHDWFVKTLLRHVGVQLSSPRCSPASCNNTQYERRSVEYAVFMSCCTSPLICFPHSATSAAVTGSFESILGSDPHLVETICSKLGVSCVSWHHIKCKTWNPPSIKPEHFCISLVHIPFARCCSSSSTFLETARPIYRFSSSKWTRWANKRSRVRYLHDEIKIYVNFLLIFQCPKSYVLLLKEDLTINFARQIARCGLAANNIKRYDIGTVYHESDAG